MCLRFGACQFLCLGGGKKIKQKDVQPFFCAQVVITFSVRKKKRSFCETNLNHHAHNLTHAIWWNTFSSLSEETVQSCIFFVSVVLPDSENGTALLIKGTLTYLKTTHRGMTMLNLSYLTETVTWKLKTPAPVFIHCHFAFFFSCLHVCLYPSGSYRGPWHLQGCWATRTSRLRSRLVKVSQTATHSYAHTNT